MSVQVAILAGGLATRLRPLSLEKPKSMFVICGRPFLAYQLEFLAAQGLRDILLCTGYLGERIEAYFRDGASFGARLQYSREEGVLLGTAGALKKAGPLLADEFFVMYGDSYLSVDFAAVHRYFKKFDKTALMTVFKNNNRYGRSNVALAGNLVAGYSKNKPAESMIYIDYGVMLFRKSVLDLIPAGEFHPLEEVLTKLAGGREMLAYEVPERFYEVGSWRGLAEFRRFIAGKKGLK
ncbi:MAG: nucleotidyl transferase [Peptococcaceae bacterium]|nr:MAG: nucleotidyl transferase [Peptococcaceae bacterium]